MQFLLGSNSIARVFPSFTINPRATNIFKYRPAVASETCSNFSMSSLVMYGLVRAKVTIFSRCPLTLRVRPARARVGSTLFQCNDGVGVSVGCDCDDAGADDDTIGGASVGAASGMASTAAGGSVACGTSASTVTACTTGSEIGSGTTSAGATAGSGAGSGGDSGAGATSSLMRKAYQKTAHF